MTGSSDSIRRGMYCSNTSPAKNEIIPGYVSPKKLKKAVGRDMTDKKIDDILKQADFNKVFYLTDTGRRWDGHKVSVRDKVNTSFTGTYHSSKQIIEAGNRTGERLWQFPMWDDYNAYMKSDVAKVGDLIKSIHKRFAENKDVIKLSAELGKKYFKKAKKWLGRRLFIAEIRYRTQNLHHWIV